MAMIRAKRVIFLALPLLFVPLIYGISSTPDDAVAQCEMHSCITTGMPASIVIGQTDFTSGEYNQEPSIGTPKANSLAIPRGIAFDSSGNLWVSDMYNSRILRYTPPFTTGMSTSLVIGQPNFTSWEIEPLTASSLQQPHAIDFDSSGNLWVADNSNNRVLRYTPPFTNGMAASLVIGQLDFTSRESNQGLGWGRPTATTLSQPRGLELDLSDNLWVADYGNSRILRYTPPFTNGMAASQVIGQPNFTSGESNQGSDSATAGSLSVPMSLTFDHRGDLWVADSGNSRVLRYSSPFRTGTVTIGQTLVLGQTDYTSNKPNAGGLPSASSLYLPYDIALSLQGDPWVTDYFNNRVLEYFRAAVLIDFSDGQQAAVVLGQTDFTSGGRNQGLGMGRPTATSMFQPSALTFDSYGNLWIADTYNHRILEFVPPLLSD